MGHARRWVAVAAMCFGPAGCISEPPTDTIPPLVSITSPASNAAVSGVVNISATATDNLGIEFVRFYAGTTVLGDDGIPPYGWLWNTTGFAPGAIELRVVARDLVGNVSEDKLTVTINNGPQ